MALLVGAGLALGRVDYGTLVPAGGMPEPIPVLAAASAAPALRAPSPSNLPSPFPAVSCADFAPAGGQLPLQAMLAHGPTPPIQLLMPLNLPEPPSQIESDMTRTETMMAVAYKKILSDPRWSLAPSAVVEVGVHQGWFASLAIKLGARSLVAFDMQPACTRAARCTLQVNGGGRAVVLNRYVGHGATPVDVSADECGPGLGLGNRARGSVSVQPVHLGAFFTDGGTLAALGLPAGFDIPLIKIDVEGFESVVLETLLPILGQVHNVLVEVFAERWAMNGIEQARALALYACLQSAGLEMVDLPRRDIDFIETGDIDLDAIPPRRVHSSWQQWAEHFDKVLAGTNGLINPNMWMRWAAPENRTRLNVAALPKCAGPLAQTAAFKSTS
jgi:hypothetical protein